MAENGRSGHRGQQTAVETEITTDGAAGQMSTAAEKMNEGEKSTAAEKMNGGEKGTAAEKMNGGEKGTAAEKLNGGEKSTAAEKLNGGEKSTAAEKLNGGEKSTAAEKLVAEADKMALVEAGHKKLCSDATLITSKDGFFKTFDKQVAGTVSDEQFDEFSQLADDQERVFFIWNLPTVHSTLKVKTFYREKNLKNAERCKNEGNKYFQQKAYKTAINHYNQAVTLAPQGDLLAVGFANRSAALFHLQLYKPCLRDIQAAMKNQYPSYLHFKIFDRKNLCLMKLGHVSEAMRALEELQQSLVFSKMDDNKRASWESDVKQRISEVSGRTDFVPIMRPADINIVQPPTIPTFNQRFHNASAAVDVRHSEDCGRFAVAAADLHPGELLLVEKPYASALLPAKMGSHCLHCLKRVLVVYPCSLCSGAVFCSLECSQLAVNHVWECQIQNLLNASGMSILCHLALRMVTKNSLQFFKDIRPALDSSCTDRSRAPCTQDGVYDASSYLSVHQLVTLSELRPHTDMFHRSLMAVFLLKCLRVVGYFRESSQTDCTPNDEDASRPLTPDEIFVGSLLLRHLQLLQFNAHEVGEYMMMSPGQFKQSRSVNIGVAVYPTVSFFNHSCEGGVARYFIGDTVVIRSVRPLSAGEVIYENYGPVYSHKSLQDRQMTLKSRYWFECKCRACVDNWPDYDQYDINTVLIRCQKCGSPIENDASGKNATGNCPSCGEQNNIIDLFGRLANAQELYQSGMLMMHEGQVDKALRAFYRFIVQSYELVCLPNRDVSLCQEAVRMCLSSFGSMHTVRSRPAL